MSLPPAHNKKTIQKGILIMKKRNIAAAILLASTMAISACAATVMTASAADYTITITKPANDTATHTYEAYQVFSGTLTGTGSTAVLSSIDWGEGVNGTAILAALKADSDNFQVEKTENGVTTLVNAFADASTAKDVAAIISEWPENDIKLQKFADVVSKNLNTTAGKHVSSAAGGSTITVAEAKPGYYFIKDSIDTSGNDTNGNKKVGANTDFILKVVDSVTVNAKEDVPTIDKKIGTSYATGTKTSTASIGDSVPFVLKSAVPDMAGYNRYYFVIEDTMETGLTFNNDVAITINGTAVPAANYTVTETGNSFKIVMKEFFYHYYQMSNTDSSDDGSLKGKDIIITYSATLNENAELYTDSNDNTVNLTFSNNPNFDYDGNKDPNQPDEPPTTPPEGKEVPPTGVTPDSQTKTYTTGIQIKKIDGTDSTPLAGVKFRLSGEGLKSTSVNGEYFQAAADGTYWQLKNGTYTTTDPNGEDVDKTAYVSETIKYKKVTVAANETAPVHIDTEVTTPNDGIISFKGLAPGTYTLTEVEAKQGYNKIDPITITITDHKTNGEVDNTGWVVTASNVTGALEQDATSKCFKFDVENNKGVTLPGTGGIGTTIFYVVGGTLTLGAITLFLTKKRMNASDQK